MSSELEDDSCRLEQGQGSSGQRQELAAEIIKSRVS